MKNFLIKATTLCACLFTLCACGTGNGVQGMSGTQSIASETVSTLPNDTPPQSPAEEVLAFIAEWHTDIYDPQKADVYRLDGLDVYLVQTIGSGYAIIVHEAETGETFVGYTQYTNISSVKKNEGGREIGLYAECSVFGGDQVFMQGTAWVNWQYETGEIVSVEKNWSDWNRIVGLQRGGDEYAFGPCYIDDAGATFLFENTYYNAGQLGGEFCPEIHLNRIWSTETEGYDIFVLVFQDTDAGSIDAAFLKSLYDMDGIHRVAITQLEEPILSGAQLVIECEPTHRLEYSFNRSGEPYRFEDFTLTVVPY